jgi:hypothetical protein
MSTPFSNFFQTFFGKTSKPLKNTDFPRTKKFQIYGKIVVGKDQFHFSTSFQRPGNGAKGYDRQEIRIT